jgi:hypothetical protein
MIRDHFFAWKPGRFDASPDGALYFLKCLDGLCFSAKREAEAEFPENLAKKYGNR